MQEAVSRLSRRLAPDSRWLLTTEEALLVYELCSFDIGVFNIKNRWCSLLEEDDEAIDIFQYAWDLEDYWIKSYGFPINSEMGCQLLTDIYESMMKVVRGDTCKIVLTPSLSFFLYNMIISYIFLML